MFTIGAKYAIIDGFFYLFYIKIVYDSLYRNTTIYHYLQLQSHSHVFQDLSSALLTILWSLGTFFQSLHQHYSKMHLLGWAQVLFQNYVIVLSRFLSCKWNFQIVYILLIINVYNWLHFWDSELILSINAVNAYQNVNRRHKSHFLVLISANSIVI